MRRRIRLAPWTLALACVCGLVGCAPGESADCDPILDTARFMAWVLEPQADLIWDSAGTITTFEGVEDLAPTTDEGWEEVAYAAGALEEAGQLLITSSLSQAGDWNEALYCLRIAGRFLTMVRAKPPRWRWACPNSRAPPAVRVVGIRYAACRASV